MTIDVRRAVVGDIDTLVTFNTAMAKETEGLFLDHERLRAGVTHLLNHESDGYYFVAVEGHADDVLGAAMVTFEWSDWRNGRFWWIQSVFVPAEQRRRGIYSALHAHIRERAQADPDGCGIRLYVEHENHTAMKTYSALGMTQTNYRLFEEDFSAEPKS